MATVISNELTSKHTVEKYSFKVLSLAEAQQKDSSNDFEPMQIKEVESPQEEKKELNVDSSAMSQSSKDALIESLMKKTDEMSSNFIKLQMKLEAMEEEHKVALQKVKDEAYNEGLEAAKSQLQQEQKNELSKAIEQFANSISTLESSAKEFVSALDGIKSSLVSAALDIAKEVIQVELGENSNEVAKVLSDELIKELQNASKIKLKVNPKNHGAISEKVGSLEHVEVVSDSAVSEGGVIAMSDVGNIDSQIDKRFERVKRAALSE